MSRNRPQSIETKIRRLEREITEIDDYFYQSEKTGDRQLYAGMLERKRDDMVRAAVLQLHTGIEDMLTSIVIQHVRRNTTKPQTEDGQHSGQSAAEDALWRRQHRLRYET